MGVSPSHLGTTTAGANGTVSWARRGVVLGRGRAAAGGSQPPLLKSLLSCVIGDVISVEKTVKRCLLDTFKHTDEEFLKQASSQ